MFNIEDIPEEVVGDNQSSPQAVSGRSIVANKTKQEEAPKLQIYGPKEHLLSSIKKFDQNKFPYRIIQERAVKVNSRKAYEFKLELEMDTSNLGKQASSAATQPNQKLKALIYLLALKSEETNKFFVLQHMSTNLNYDIFEEELENVVSHIVRSVKIFKSKKMGGFKVLRKDVGISMHLLDESWQIWRVSDFKHHYTKPTMVTKKGGSKSPLVEDEDTKVELPQHLKQDKVLIYLLSALSKDTVGKELAIMKIEQVESETFDDFLESTKTKLKCMDNFVELRDRVKFVDEACSEGVVFAYVGEYESFPVNTSVILTPQSMENLDLSKKEKYNVIDCYFSRGSNWYRIFSRSHYSQSLTFFRDNILSQLSSVSFCEPVPESSLDNTFLLYENKEYHFVLEHPILHQISAKQSLGSTPVCQYFVRFSMKNMLHMLETQVIFEKIGNRSEHENLLTDPTERMKRLKQSLYDQMIRNLGKPIPLRTEREVRLGDVDTYNVTFTTPIGSPIHQKNLMHMHTSFIIERPDQSESSSTVYLVSVKSNTMDAFYNDQLEKLIETLHSSFTWQ